MEPKLDFTDKVVMITGASRGLGRAMTEGFAKGGAAIAAIARKQDGLDELARELDAQGTEVFTHSANVGDWDAGAEAIEAVKARFGRIDVLVNNAGASPVLGKLTDLDEAGFDKIFDVNVKSVWRLSTLAAEMMVEAGGGAIVNISSTAAALASAPVAPYAAAKGAVNVMTKALARAYGPTVRVNGVMYGAFRTDLTKSFIDHPAFLKRLQATSPAGRPGEPDEAAGAVLYLASGLASHTSGAIVTVDGGES